MLEDGLDECKRLSVTWWCIVGDDGSGILVVEPFLNTFLGTPQRLRQLLQCDDTFWTSQSNK